MTLPTDENTILSLFEALPDSLVVVDGRGKFIYASSGETHQPGANFEEMLSGIHPEDRPKLQAVVEKCLASSESLRETFRTPSKEDHWNWHECSAVGRTHVDGSRVAILVCRDISEQVAREDSLRGEEERFRELTENATDLIVEVDDSGRLLYMSPSSTKLIGRKPEEVIGIGISDFQDSFSSDAIPLETDAGLGVAEALQQTLALGASGNLMRFQFAHPDGNPRWFEMRARSFTRRDGSIRIVVISRDVTDRVHAEQELRESEERYRIISTVTKDVISEITSSGEIAYVSSNCQDVIGFSPEALLRMSPLDLIHPEDVDNVRPLLLSQPSTLHKTRLFSPYRIRHADGHWVWVEGAGISYEKSDGEIRFLALSRDISERRKQEEVQRALEEQVRQAQKLEGLGVMAGGIAHDFNNFLTPILGEAGLILEDLAPNSPLKPRLEKIQAATRRAALLTSQMLAYAGKKTLSVSEVHLSNLVEEMAALLSSGISKKIRVEQDLPQDIPCIQADPSQLTQVVMNLITNASEAVGDTEGAIAIRTGRVHSRDLDPQKLVLAADSLSEGEYVFVAVEDTGTGMSPTTLARIFDPFFTTKFAGRGLGLAAVLGIVRSHHGAMEIESGPTQGTQFRVFFPASPQSHDAKGVASPEPIGAWQGQGTVLIIDDDDGVVEFAQETLRRCGLDILTATDGHTGLELFKENADRIDIVLLDRTMPGMSGEEVVSSMRALSADVQIILVSGYSEERASLHFQETDLAAFLQKPFMPEKLVETIQKILSP